MIMRMVVVLPAPLGPMKPQSDPAATVRSRSRTATFLPNAFVTWRTAIASLMAPFR